MSERMPFTTDEWNRSHAYLWAVDYFGEENGHAFVAYLASLDAEDQARVADRGYHVVAEEFEATMK